mmetsp:Transcript_28685/g.57253  ORF Transcript_28685/g.57253 Transcript_28685/m.57253 type:complete len:230 (-) Transcript_28685:66-755(-)
MASSAMCTLGGDDAAREEERVSIAIALLRLCRAASKSASPFAASPPHEKGSSFHKRWMARAWSRGWEARRSSSRPWWEEHETRNARWRREGGCLEVRREWRRVAWWAAWRKGADWSWSRSWSALGARWAGEYSCLLAMAHVTSSSASFHAGSSCGGGGGGGKRRVGAMTGKWNGSSSTSSSSSSSWRGRRKDADDDGDAGRDSSPSTMSSSLLLLLLLLLVLLGKEVIS